MNKIKLILMAAAATIVAGMVLQSCDEGDSYAEQKSRERKVIRSFIKKGTLIKATDANDTLVYVAPIKTISEEEFNKQDSTTDVSKNEYVLFKSSGVYMQIIRKGVGKKLLDGETATILARYTEVNLRGDSIQTSNDNLYSIAIPDVMTISNSKGKFTASFVSGQMYTSYNASVPSGWLIPFTYINIGRQEDANSQIAKVRLIVPSEEGQKDASGNVYACFYEITFQKGYR